jgi:hypothetical protein
VKKIKTLFQRDPDDRRFVTREVESGCEWVLDGEGIATRKYDGTCVMWDGDRWWARREVKPGKVAPEGFRSEQHDAATGKTVGWEPAGQSAFAKYIKEAVAGWTGYDRPGTFELIGPKINGNPEDCDRHFVMRHEYADVYQDVPRDFDGLAAWLLARPDLEGLVFHHDDGRMVKIKRRDFAAGNATYPQGDNDADT